MLMWTSVRKTMLRWVVRKINYAEVIGEEDELC